MRFNLLHLHKIKIMSLKIRNNFALCTLLIFFSGSINIAFAQIKNDTINTIQDTTLNVVTDSNAIEIDTVISDINDTGIVVTKTDTTLLTIAKDTVKENEPVIDSANAQSWLSEGLRKMKNGSFSEAVNYLTEAIKIDPDLALAFELRGYARRIALDETIIIGDMYEEVLEDFTKAIEIYNNQLSQLHDREKKDVIREKIAVLLVDRGITKMRYKSKKFYKLAIEDFDEAYRYDQDNYDIFIYRSECFRELREFNREIIDLRRIISEASKPGSPLFDKLNLAKYYYLMGDALINDSNDRRNACEFYKKSMNLGYQRAISAVSRICNY